MAAGFGPIAGLKIGHAQDDRALTGCTVLLADAGPAPYDAGVGMVAGCDVRGGAVGERELETLRPGHVVERIHALVLAGGSAFGLDAAAGVMRWCEERGIGFDTGVARIPIVPAAILFDLRIGEPSTSFGPRPRPRHPDAAMGYAAAEAAAQAKADAPVAEGNVGAGTGATVGKLFGIERATKGGIGCWTEELPDGVRVAALAVVNAFGDIRDPESGKILGGARGAEDFREFADTAAAMRSGTVRKRFSDPNTVLVAVATNAGLGRSDAQRMAVMAAAGMARVISPAHTTFDGDVVFALSIGDGRADVNALGAAAAEAVARAIVRGVTQARSAGGVPAAGG
ncbi:MAG: P1 family peptidase [Candidatus Acidiferrales bacterium]